MLSRQMGQRRRVVSAPLPQDSHKQRCLQGISTTHLSPSIQMQQLLAELGKDGDKDADDGDDGDSETTFLDNLAPRELE